MSLWKASGLAIFAAVCLLGETAGSARAPVCFLTDTICATEWSGGSAIKLGGLPGNYSGSTAYGINDAGQAVGVSFVGGTADG
jgi:hypothetical protein